MFISLKSSLFFYIYSTSISLNKSPAFNKCSDSNLNFNIKMVKASSLSSSNRNNSKINRSAPKSLIKKIKKSYQHKGFPSGPPP